jgi:CheY-like chemotaxis protein
MREMRQQRTLLSSLAARTQKPAASGARKDVSRGLPGEAVRSNPTHHLPATPFDVADPLAKFCTARRGNLPVLIVLEDNAEHFLSLKRALWKSGATAQVWWARDVSEALDILGQLESRASALCVLACLQAPGADFALAKAVKGRNGFARPRFAFITQATERSNEDRAYAAGADAFFVKPERAEAWAEIARALQLLALAPTNRSARQSIAHPPGQRPDRS